MNPIKELRVRRSPETPLQNNGEQSEIDAALEVLGKAKPEQRIIISRIQKEHGGRSWQATSEDVWFIGHGDTAQAAVADFLDQDKKALPARIENLRKELETLERRAECRLSEEPSEGKLRVEAM